ncbi:MAG TPA: SRPBCC family protein [Bacteroidales bacterium]|nr:SRPBCC family protein [Bacteroidales bacterium]
MKILKNILYAIVGLIVIMLLIGLFVSKDYAVERQVTIDKSKDVVFDYVKYLKNQNTYSVWIKADPNIKTNFTGTDATPGFISAWESLDKNIGKGEQEITKIVDGERIDYELRFMEPMKATNLAYMTTESVTEGQTLVRWGFSGHMKYPMNLTLLFMNMDKMIGKDFEDGLLNLKTILESQPAPMPADTLAKPE